MKTLVAASALAACAGDEPPPPPRKAGGVATSCGNAVVDRQNGELCDPNDPATRMEAGTNMPCNPQLCNYTPNGPQLTPPAQGDMNCPPPVAQIECGEAHQYNTQTGQSYISYYNATCGRQPTPGPELAYAFTVPMIPKQPLKAVPVLVTLNDGNDNEDLDIYVIAPGSDGVTCSPQDCISWGQRSAEFAGLPGQTYTLIVDGRRPRNYRLDVQCRFDQARACQSTQIGPICQ